MATNAYWREFGTLLLAAILGGLAIMPYSLRLIKTSNKPTGLPLSTILLLSIIQNTILSAIAIGIGLVAAHSIGLGVPYITAIVTGGQVQARASMLLLAMGMGLVDGFVLMLLDILFLPYWPKPVLELALSASLWENFTASFYGSINEELLTRLFGVSVTAWLLGRIWHTTSGAPTSAVFWAAIVLLAVLFAVGHLPTLKGLVNEVSPTIA